MMNINRFHHRKTIRLKGYDYSQSGFYYVTVCTQNRECLLGEIIDRKMVLNEIGEIVDDILNSLPNRYEQIKLDIYQIMPNHVHTIIQIVGAHHDAPIMHHDTSVYKRAIHESPLQKRSLLSRIIGYFKMNSAKLIHQINPNIPVWQRNYEVYPEGSRRKHIIRNENELNAIRQYIIDNPKNWAKDENNPNLI